MNLFWNGGRSANRDPQGARGSGPFSPQLKILAVFLILFFAGAHFWFGLGSISSHSPTFDEPVHLTAGFISLTEGNYKQQYRFNGFDHPPLAEMWAALPLAFMPVALPKDHPAWATQKWRHFEQYPFANRFVFDSGVPGMINAGRKMILILSICLGLALFFRGAALYGWGAGFIALALWAFSPTMLAHGTVVSTDLAFALFYFLFFALLATAKTNQDRMGTGLALAGCLTSKFFSILVFPAWIAVAVWKKISRSGKAGEGEKKTGSWKQIALILGVAFLAVGILYRFDGLDIFYKGMRGIFIRANRADHASFFMGDYSPGRKLLYFPVLFILKTPLPVLIAFVLSLSVLFLKKIKIRPEFIIPPLLIFAAACLAQKQIGHRYILAVYPFLFIIIAAGLSHLPKKGMVLAVLLLGWQAAGTVSASPHFLSYFNPLGGGPEKTYQLFTDSNLDWGQGLLELKKSLTPEQEKEGIYLDYFGVTPPRVYDIPFINAGVNSGLVGESHSRGKLLSPKTIVVSATRYQEERVFPDGRYQWLGDKNPDRVVDSSLLFFPVESKPPWLD